MKKTLSPPLEAVKNEIQHFVTQMLLASIQTNAQDQTAVPVPEKPATVEKKVEEVSKDTALEFVSSKNAPVEKKPVKKVDFFAALSDDVKAEFEGKYDRISNAFGRNLLVTFEALLTPPVKLQKKKNGSALDGLELVDEETLMFRLVLDNFSAKVNDDYKIGIALTCLRFEKMLGFEIDLLQSPLAPYSIGNALNNALAEVELSLDKKKLLLIAILKTLIVEYAKLLKQANESFIKKNILPRLTEADAKVRIEKYLRKMKAQENGEEDEDEEQIVNSRPGAEGASAFTRKFFQEIAIPQASEHSVASNPNGELITQERLLSNISTMQTGLVKVDEKTGYMQPVESEKTFSKLLAENSDIGEYALSAEHSKTIGIISMLFDTLRNEESISPPIKALLVQLTVPLLKAAVQDDEFFKDKWNPAQVLFNSIAEASSSWSAENSVNNDFLYQKMSSIVQKVTEEYDDDGIVFENAIEDFSSFVDKESQKTQRIEERIIATETAQARIHAARKFAQKRIFDVFGDFILDEALKYFIDNVWEQALFYIANTHIDNKDAVEWQQIQSIESKLVHILDHVAISCSLDDLFKEMAQFLKSAGSSDADIKTEFEKIRSDLAALIDNAEEGAGTGSKAVTGTAATIFTQPVVGSPQAAVDSDSFVLDDVVDLGDVVDLCDLSDIDAVLDVDSVINDYEKNYQAAQEADTKDWLSKVGIGCWMEDKEFSPPLRVKLAAHIKYTDTYVFVNRKGVKAVSYDGPALAQRMHDKIMIIVDNSQLYDRAIENIIGNLRTEASV